jgi:hypothetical protein
LLLHYHLLLSHRGEFCLKLKRILSPSMAKSIEEIAKIISNSLKRLCAFNSKAWGAVVDHAMLGSDMLSPDEEPASGFGREIFTL